MLRTPDHVQTSGHAVSAPTLSVSRQVGHFVRHYVEMCVPMCIGFAVGDIVYFGIAARFGYSQPFSELPVLSVVVVTLTMTAPMVAWMRFRGMGRRPGGRDGCRHARSRRAAAGPRLARGAPDE